MTRTTFVNLTPGLWVCQSELYATNHGVWIDRGEACLIDPGLTDATLDETAAFVTEQGAEVSTLILTHGHWDHLLGVSRFPQAQVIAQAGYPAVLEEHGRDLQQQVNAWMQDNEGARMRPFVLPHPTDTFDETMTLTLGATTLRLLHTPGHAPDHLSVYAAETRTLWAGDLLSDLEIPLVSHRLKAYERTLATLDALDVTALVPGHGTVTTDPTEIAGRVAEDRAYLNELRARVEGALGEGRSMAATVDACDEMTFRHPERNATAHRWNVESAYVELGGHVDGAVGWHQEW
jgi:glyoxylase-like metal-dependent hydrolase (beta-lactamase superfamily II)